MPGGVVIEYWVVIAIGISIKGLGINCTWDNGIGCNKPPESGVIVAGFVEVEAGAGVQLLPGVFIRDVGGAGVGIGSSWAFPLVSR